MKVKVCGTNFLRGDFKTLKNLTFFGFSMELKSEANLHLRNRYLFEYICCVQFGPSYDHPSCGDCFSIQSKIQPALSGRVSFFYQKDFYMVSI